MRSLGCLVIVAACGGGKPTTTPPVTTQQQPKPEQQQAQPPASGAPAYPGSVAIASSEKRTVVGRGKHIGTYEIAQLADGHIKLALDVLQNGRGPHVDATLLFDQQGLPLSYRATGHYEFRTKIDETFQRIGKKASWKSNEEQGDSATAGAFYLPLAPSPMGHWVVKAALKSGGKLTLLPVGEARVDKAGEMTVSADGQTKKIIAYTISGTQFAPSFVWFDEQMNWFGTFSSWRSYAPLGWESVVDSIVAKQDELERANDQAVVAAAAKKPPAAGIAFTNARVLDVAKGTWLADHTVVVVGDAIKAVGPSKTVKPPAGAEVVDLKGHAIVPGMFDMHMHLDRVDAVLSLASGVTTGRDVGGLPDQLDQYKQWFDEGTAAGPRVLRMGFIEGRNPLAAASKITAETPDEAKAAVEFFHKRNYEGIKIYNSVKPELVPLLAREAHKKGMLVTGHIPVHMLAHEAVKAGYDGIEHINMLFLNFLATHETDTRTPLRFTLVGDKAATVDFASKPVQDFFALLRKHKTVITPTAVAFEDLLVGEPGKVIPGREAMVARYPALAQRGELVNGLPMEGDKRALYREAHVKMLAMVKALYDTKIHLAIGTDYVGGLGFHHELALFARAKIPNAAILRMATIDAARAMKVDKKLGSITAGKQADFFVVPDDPLVDVTAVRGVHTVVSRGVVWDSAKLYAAVNVAP